MEPERSLPHSQQPNTCPYPETDQSSTCHFLKIHFNIILPSTSSQYITHCNGLNKEKNVGKEKIQIIAFR